MGKANTFLRSFSKSFLKEPALYLFSVLFFGVALFGLITLNVNQMDQPFAKDVPQQSLSAIGGYFFEEHAVYFGSKKVEDVKPESFVAHECGYATDGSVVFVNGQKMPHMSAEGFMVLSCKPALAKNNDHVFVGDSILFNAEPHSFTLLTEAPNGYAKDERHVYYFSHTKEPYIRPIVGIDPYTLEMPYSASEYAKDAQLVYYEGEQIPHADPITFVYLGQWYAQDAFSVFHKASVISIADAASFMLSDGGWFDAEDRKQWYKEGMATRPPGRNVEQSEEEL